MSRAWDGRFIFVDTETTSLGRDKDVWEIGLIVRTATGDREQIVQITDVPKFGFAPESSAINGAETRAVALGGTPLPGTLLMSESDAASYLRAQTHGAIMVGANVAFDLEGIETMMRWNDLDPAWYYQPYDVTQMAAMIAHLVKNMDLLTVSPSSRVVRNALGLPTAAPGEEHTALGDARWVRDWWDLLTTHPSFGGGRA